MHESTSLHDSNRVTINCHLCGCVSLVTALCLLQVLFKWVTSGVGDLLGRGSNMVAELSACPEADWMIIKRQLGNLLIWDIAKVTAGCKKGFEELSLCSCFALNIQRWRCGALVGVLDGCFFSLLRSGQAFCVWEHHFSHDALHSFYTWILAVEVRATSYPTCFLWII